MAPGKSSRQNLILMLLSRGPVPSQAFLRKALLRRGIRATQATLSRDFRELGLVKTAGGYHLPERPAPAPTGTGSLSHVYEALPAGNLVVLKTGPGQASLTALLIDREEIPGVCGTLAGDDTVFVATRTGKGARALARRFRGKA